MLCIVLPAAANLTSCTGAGTGRRSVVRSGFSFTGLPCAVGSTLGRAWGPAGGQLREEGPDGSPALPPTSPPRVSWCLLPGGPPRVPASVHGRELWASHPSLSACLVELHVWLAPRGHRWSSRGCSYTAHPHSVHTFISKRHIVSEREKKLAF